VLRTAFFVLLPIVAVVLPTVPDTAEAELQFTFEGGGYGHSVGLSQFGAYGMALEGATWEEIVTHYYTGITIGDVDPAAAARPLWIGLTQERERIDLTVFSTGLGTPVPVAFTMGNASLQAGVGDTVTVTDLGGGRCRVAAPGGSLEGPCSLDARWDGRQPNPTVGLQLGGCTLPDWNSSTGVVYRPCRYARGDMHVRPDDLSGLNLSVEIGIEDYLLGISEMPYFWGTAGGAAALQAQAFAARSYALHRAIVRGNPTDRPWCSCHLYDTTVDQFYVGWGQEQPAWTNAVRSTAGKVGYHPDATWYGSPIPIQAFYSSSTFGWTEASEVGFFAPIEYLRPVDDHWSGLPQVGNHSFRWTRTFGASELASRLPGLTSVTGAEITACSVSGAAQQITFSGNGGPRTFATRDLRSLLGLRSMQIIDVGAPPSGSSPCSRAAPTVAGEGGPVALHVLYVDDDSTEDSRGNGDGIAACGESVEITATIQNLGGELTGAAATLVADSPYLTIDWNTSTPLSGIAAGGFGATTDDWDVTIAPDTPDGSLLPLRIRVDAADGGPWLLDTTLPVTCTETPSPALLVQVTDDRFVDDDGSVHEANIDFIAAAGITIGCNPPDNDRYCPDQSVTRGQMAAFLRRYLEIPASAGDAFGDDGNSIFHDDINALAAAGIAFGCDANRYCPDAPLRREEMAEFLVRAFGYDDPGPGDLFDDDNTSQFQISIDALRTAGITKGCDLTNPRRFCPTEPMTRAQMASFLARAIGYDG
jgi:SpoIID/LytB domain protein